MRHLAELTLRLVCCMVASLEHSANAPVPVECIVLAGGLSSRMGAEHWKMQLPLHLPTDAQTCSLLALPDVVPTILDHSIANALSFCSRVLLVTGHRHNELEARYQSHPDIHLVHNPDYCTGQVSSVLAGLSQVTTGYVFITLGDLPFLSRNLFSTLWAARGEKVVLPAFDGQQGHPVLVPSAVIPKVMDKNLSGGMKKRFAKYAVTVDIQCADILRDIDSPEAYYKETGIVFNS